MHAARQQYPCCFWPIVLLIGNWVLSSGSAQLPASPPSNLASTNDLSKDVRLHRIVAYNETGVPLNELLRQASDKTVALSASRSCESLKIQLRLKNRPLWTLMEALAELLPGRWETENGGEGYRLVMDDESVARRDRWWKLFLAERERALKVQRTYILEQMRAMPSLTEPKPEPQHTFFSLLPAELQERIANQMMDNAFYRAKGLSNLLYEGAMPVRLHSLPQRAQELVGNGCPEIGFGNPLIVFMNNGYHIAVRAILPDGRWQALGLDLSIGKHPTNMALSLNHKGLPDIFPHLSKVAPDSWKLFVEYQDSRVWKNDLPTRTKITSPPFRRAEALCWLADQAGIEFVADFYSVAYRPMSAAQKRQPLRRPLKEELDYQAADHDMSWKQREDDIYLFRNNRWYRDDYLEVPAPLLQRLLSLVDMPEDKKAKDSKGKEEKTPVILSPAEQIKKQLDLEAEIVTTLSPWQIANGLVYFALETGGLTPDPKDTSASWSPFGYIADRTLTEYYTALFYAGLTEAQRGALVGGDLPFASLSPVQREQALRICPAIHAFLGGDQVRVMRLGLHVTAPDVMYVYGYNSASGFKIPPQTRLMMTSSATISDP